MKENDAFRITSRETAGRLLCGVVIFAGLIFTAPAKAVDFYFTAGLGPASLNHPGDNKWFIQKGWDYEIDEKSTGYKLGLGAKFSKYLSLEANYHNFGKYKHFAAFMQEENEYNPHTSNLCNSECPPTTWGYLSGKASAISFTVLPAYPITKDLSVYGRLGYAYFRAQFEVHFTPGDTVTRNWQYITLTSRDWTPVLGGGIRYGNWSLDAVHMTYLRVTGKQNDCCGPYTSATAWTIGYQWELK